MSLTTLSEVQDLVISCGLDMNAVGSIVREALEEDLGGRGVLAAGSGQGVDVTSVATIPPVLRPILSRELRARLPACPLPRSPWRRWLRPLDLSNSICGSATARGCREANFSWWPPRTPRRCCVLSASP